MSGDTNKAASVRPAGAALALVLDGRDDALGAPVDAGGQRASGQGLASSSQLGRVVDGVAQVQVGKLGMGKVGDCGGVMRGCGSGAGKHSLTPRVQLWPSLLNSLMYRTADL